jgi:hypothetical protein
VGVGLFVAVFARGVAGTGAPAGANSVLAGFRAAAVWWRGAARLRDEADEAAPTADDDPARARRASGTADTVVCDGGGAATVRALVRASRRGV